MIKKNIKTINLALQGGGSHGAFTWGVLDRFLDEEDHVRIEGISGASAGALNGALFLQGYEKNGAAGARAALDNFWGRVGGMAAFGTGQRTILDQMLGNWNMDLSPGSMMLDMMGRMFSPYQVNPMNINPLRDLMAEMIDVPSVRRSANFKFFVAATNVQSGKVRIFSRDEVSIDVLMASACFPFSFQAVEIDGSSYWDGGYTGNPPLFPIIRHCQSKDIVVVQLIPLHRKGTPGSMNEIINRMDEITFNTSLMGEMRSIALVNELIGHDLLKAEARDHLKELYVHAIRDDEGLSAVGSLSRLNTELGFLLHLKELGRAATGQWLADHGNDIGERSSVNIRQMFLD